MLIAGIEVMYEISHGDLMHIVANIAMGFVSLSFCGFYLMSGKQSNEYVLLKENHDAAIGSKKSDFIHCLLSALF